jgi:hypothetical protein
MTFRCAFYLRIELAKDELHKQTWRTYRAMAGLAAAVYFIARYVH